MKQLFFPIVLIGLLCAALAGCGDNNGPLKNVTFKVGLSGTVPATTPIAGAEITLTLPTDVTPATVNGAVESSVVTPSGTFSGGTALPPVYTPATATTPGTLKIVLVNSSPAGVSQAGEVATVNLQLANSATPTEASFPPASTSARVIDTLGSPISGLLAVVSRVLVH